MGGRAPYPCTLPLREWRWWYAKQRQARRTARATSCATGSQQIRPKSREGVHAGAAAMDNGQKCKLSGKAETATPPSLLAICRKSSTVTTITRIIALIRRLRTRKARIAFPLRHFLQIDDPGGHALTGLPFFSCRPSLFSDVVSLY